MGKSWNDNEMRKPLTLRLTLNPRNRGLIMMKRLPRIAAALSLLLLAGSLLQAQEPKEPKDLTEGIFESLQEIQTVKVGMTRADLLKVFTTEGGLSTGISRTYVFRKCAYIKVDVEFEPVGRPATDDEGRVTLIESDKDVIKEISKPYLELSIFD